MSAARRLLERPLVIGAVATGLVAVALLNIWTFREETYSRYMGKAEDGSRMNTGTESVSFLMDSVVPDEAASGQTVSSAAHFSWPKNARDPFGPQQQYRNRELDFPLRVDAWRLDAVVLRGGEQVALINGSPYKIGELVGEAELVSIDKQGVTLLEDNEELRLPVDKESAGDGAVTVVMGSLKENENITPRPEGPGDHGGER